ncbi:hypothetical protein ACFFK0_09595 [Paenibacillus chartarius]|uniref:Cadherin domain-containing protein n=1 Tax=Paenibacillus chartarius TaxID=747481 RepID=A0ABV6DJE7_9BACL
MGRRKSKTKQYTANTKIAAALAATLGIVPAAAPAAYAAAEPFTILGQPGESKTIKLATNSFSTFKIDAETPGAGNIAEWQLNGAFLNVKLRSAGFAKLTVTNMVTSQQQTVNVNVIGLGANGRADIGDLVSHMYQYGSQNSFKATDLATAIETQVAPVASEMPFNHAPKVVRVPEARYKTQNELMPYIDVTQFFDDEDPDDFLRYSIDYNPTSTGLRASLVSGSLLSVTGFENNDKTISVTATDRAGLSASTLVVVKPNHAPTVSSVTYSVYAPIGYVDTTVELNKLVKDADNDTLTFILNEGSEHQNGVNASISGSKLQLSGTMTAPSRFYVLANDGKSANTVTAEVYLDPEAPQHVNRPPFVITASHTYEKPYLAELEPIDVSADFSDPDGDSLVYAVSPQTEGGVTASMSGSWLTFSGSLFSDAAFTVYAEDPQGLRSGYATYQFVAIPPVNHAPSAHPYNFTFPYDSGDSVTGVTYNLDNIFTDADNDTLTFGINEGQSTSGATISATINGSTLSFNGTYTGSPVHYVIYAEDSKGARGEAVFTFKSYEDLEAVQSEVIVYEQFYHDEKDKRRGVFFPVNLRDNFIPKNGGTMSYTVDEAPAWNVNGVKVDKIEHDQLYFAGDLKGTEAAFTITATETAPGGRTSSASAVYKVRANTVPSVTTDTYRELLFDGDPLPEPIDLTELFYDMDGDTLSYDAKVISGSGITPLITGNMFSLTGSLTEDVTIKIWAKDSKRGENYVTYTLLLGGTPRVIEANITEYFTVNGADGGENVFNLSENFIGVGTGPLTFTAEQIGTTVPDVYVDGEALPSGYLVLRGNLPEGKTVSYKVTASQTIRGEELSSEAVYTFSRNHKPVVTSSYYEDDYYKVIRDGDSLPQLDLSQLFKDDDGDALTYELWFDPEQYITAYRDGNIVRFDGNWDSRKAQFDIVANDGKYKSGAHIHYELVPPVFESNVTHYALNGEIPYINLWDNFNKSSESEELSFEIVNVVPENAELSEEDGWIYFNENLYSGSIELTVKATETTADGTKFDSQAIYTVLPNTAPTVTDEYNNYSIYIEEGQTLPTLNLLDIFQDADGDTLEYSADWYGDIEPIVTGTELTFTGDLTERAVIYLYAEDKKGGHVNTRITFRPLSNPTVHENSVSLYQNRTPNNDVYLPMADLSGNFTSSHGGDLEYSVVGDNPADGLTAYFASGNLYFTGELTGPEATFIVKAAEPYKPSYYATASYTVYQNNVTTVSSSSYELTLEDGEPLPDIDLNTIFSDGDQDAIDYDVYTYMSGGLTASISDSGVLSFTGPLASMATFTVTGTDHKSDPVYYYVNLKPIRNPVVKVSEPVIYWTDGELLKEPYGSEYMWNMFESTDGGNLSYYLMDGAAETNQLNVGGLTVNLDYGQLSFSGTLNDDEAMFTVKAKEEFNGKTFESTVPYRILKNAKPSLTKPLPLINAVPNEYVPITTIDLRDYFTDSDNDTITFEYDWSSASGALMDYIVDGHKLVYSGTFWSGGYLYFYASDGKSARQRYGIEVNTPVTTKDGVSTNEYYTPTVSGSSPYVSLYNKFYDRESNELSFSLSSTSSLMTDESNGVTATLDSGNLVLSGSFDNWSTPATFMVTATDGKGPALTVPYTINPIIDLADSYTVYEAEGLSLSLKPLFIGGTDGRMYTVDTWIPGTYGSEQDWVHTDETDPFYPVIEFAGHAESRPTDALINVTISNTSEEQLTGKTVTLRAPADPLTEPVDYVFINLNIDTESVVENLYELYAAADAGITSATRFTIAAMEWTGMESNDLAPTVTMEGNDLKVKSNGLGHGYITLVGTDPTTGKGIIDRFAVIVDHPV